jgi:2Fe-2S ferredoxin
MPTVTFVGFDGIEQKFEAKSGVSLMQVAVDNGVDAIVAECGGACSCATCHCHIDESWVAKIPEVAEMEEAMLDCVLDRQETSRLSCQVIITDALDGLIVKLPESQY